MMVLLTRPRMPSGVARSMAAISAALPVGASRSGIATGSATSGDGSTTAATPRSTVPAVVIAMTRCHRDSRPWSFGAITAPRSPPAMIPAWVSPITPGAVPARRRASVIVKIAPVKAKLTSGASMITVRSGWLRHTRCSPSMASRHSAGRSPERPARNLPRIRLTAPAENRYDTASAANGTARPSPNRKPPSAGPTRPAVYIRASVAVRRDPLAAGYRTVLKRPPGFRCLAALLAA